LLALSYLKKQNFEYQKTIIGWKRVVWIWIFISAATIWSVAARLYGLPLLVGLFLYRAPLIEYFFERRYWPAVHRRLISVVLLQNFILSGMLPIVSVLIVYCEKNMG